MYTRALHAFLSLTHCRAASTVIPLLPQMNDSMYLRVNMGRPTIGLGIYVCAEQQLVP